MLFFSTFGGSNSNGHCLGAKAGACSLFFHADEQSCQRQLVSLAVKLEVLEGQASALLFDHGQRQMLKLKVCPTSRSYVLPSVTSSLRAIVISLIQENFFFYIKKNKNKKFSPVFWHIQHFLEALSFLISGCWGLFKGIQLVRSSDHVFPKITLWEAFCSPAQYTLLSICLFAHPDVYIFRG